MRRRNTILSSYVNNDVDKNFSHPRREIVLRKRGGKSNN